MSPSKSASNRQNYEVIILDIVSCKWTASILRAIDSGVLRPGELKRACPPISTKVLNESLGRLVDYGMLTKVDFGELPLRVEYSLTKIGKEALNLIDAAAAIKSHYLKE